MFSLMRRGHHGKELSKIDYDISTKQERRMLHNSGLDYNKTKRGLEHLVVHGVCNTETKKRAAMSLITALSHTDWEACRYQYNVERGILSEKCVVQANGDNRITQNTCFRLSLYTPGEHLDDRSLSDVIYVLRNLEQITNCLVSGVDHDEANS